MNLKQALKRIEELEARVKELETRQPQLQLVPMPYPVPVPAVPNYPTLPNPYHTEPWLPPMPVWCGPTTNWGAAS